MVFESLFNLDAEIFLFVNKGLANSFFDFFFFYFNKLPYVVYPLLILFFIKKDRNLASLLAVSLIISMIIVPVIKHAIGRDRPFEVLDSRVFVRTTGTEKSFPSNHAFQAFMVATLVFSSYRRLGILLFLMGAVLSFGRMYLGVHYLTDVIGGALMGILFALLILRISQTAIKRKTS